MKIFTSLIFTLGLILTSTVANAKGNRDLYIITNNSEYTFVQSFLSPLACEQAAFNANWDNTSDSEWYECL